MPLKPRFSPFAVNLLPRSAASCYHWPMSHEPTPPGSGLRCRPPSQASSQFPKWNSILTSRHAPTPNARLLAIDHSSLTVDKRATQKLEFHISLFYSATSKFLIDNFHRYLSSGFSSHSLALTQEGPLATRHCISNRHTYEKLEVGLSLSPSTKVLVLIDTKMHFVQGNCPRQHQLPGFDCHRRAASGILFLVRGAYT